MNSKQTLLEELGANQLKPRGFFVYCLWDDDEVIYVGQSRNLCARLGTHMQDDRFGSVDNVSYVQCANAQEMCSLEAFLIARWQPISNTKGTTRPPNIQSPEEYANGKAIICDWISRTAEPFAARDIKVGCPEYRYSRSWIYKILYQLEDEGAIKRIPVLGMSWDVTHWQRVSVMPCYARSFTGVTAITSR